MSYHYREMWVSSSSGSSKKPGYTKALSFQEHTPLMAADKCNSHGFPAPAGIWEGAVAQSKDFHKCKASPLDAAL